VGRKSHRPHKKRGTVKNTETWDGKNPKHEVVAIAAGVGGDSIATNFSSWIVKRKIDGF